MNEFPITISFQNNISGLSFANIQELNQWMINEKSKFEWLVKIKRNFSNHVWTHINQQFSPLQNQINAIIKNQSTKTTIKGNLEAIENWFIDTYNNKKLIISNSPDFFAVDELKDKNPIKASIFLGHLISVQNLYSNGIELPEIIEGSHEYFQYIEGLSKKDLNAQRKSLEKLKSEWESHLLEYKNQGEQLKSDINANKVNFEEYFLTAQKRLDDQLEKYTEEMEELKKTYDQYMSMKAPVKYWNEKRTKHIENSNKFRGWAIGIGLIGSIAFVYFLRKEFLNNQIEYWKISVFILFGTLFFWILRILVKLMLSNIHLSGDSLEREVMCQTYLSLLREQSGLSDNDKKLILGTLFRSSSMGIVSDDGIPPGVYDIVTKLISK